MQCSTSRCGMMKSWHRHCRLRNTTARVTQARSAVVKAVAMAVATAVAVVSMVHWEQCWAVVMAAATAEELRTTQSVRLGTRQEMRS